MHQPNLIYLVSLQRSRALLAALCVQLQLNAVARNVLKQHERNLDELNERFDAYVDSKSNNKYLWVKSCAVIGVGLALLPISKAMHDKDSKGRLLHDPTSFGCITHAAGHGIIAVGCLVLTQNFLKLF